MKESEEIREWYKEHREPKERDRIRYAKQQLESLGYTVKEDSASKSLAFVHNGNTIRLFPYKGWFTGKGIKDGRGLDKLIKQLQSSKRETHDDNSIYSKNARE